MRNAGGNHFAMLYMISQIERILIGCLIFLDPTSACSASVQIIRIHPILMSILLHEFKQITECIEQVKQIEESIRRVKEGGEELVISPSPPPLPRQHANYKSSDLTLWDFPSDGH